MISFTAFAKMDFDITRLDGMEGETNEVIIETPFTSINIDDSSSDVRILPSENKQCKIVFHENEKIRHKAAVTGSTLNITKTEEEYSHFFFFNFHRLYMEIYLPKKEPYSDWSDLLCSGTFLFFFLRYPVQKPFMPFCSAILNTEEKGGILQKGRYRKWEGKTGKENI